MATTNEVNELFATCPNCKASLKVRVGRKSTCRTSVCHACGKRYDYSAWQLTTPRPDGESVSLRSFYQVEFVEID
jgi:transcription elongation factor Elf1